MWGFLYEIAAVHLVGLSDLAGFVACIIVSEYFRRASWTLFYGKYGSTVELKLEHPLKS